MGAMAHNTLDVYYVILIDLEMDQRNNVFNTFVCTRAICHSETTKAYSNCYVEKLIFLQGQITRTTLILL